MCLLVLALFCMPVALRAQDSRSADASFRPRPLSADTRAAVQSVMKANQLIRQQRNELQEFGTELWQARKLLPELMGESSTQGIDELRARTARMKSLLGAVRAKSPSRREFASTLPALEERSQRLFVRLDGILDAPPGKLRAQRAAALYQELTLAMPRHKWQIDLTPTHRAGYPNAVDEEGGDPK